MARPSKAATVIKMEGKSHRTKKELATREKAEKALLSGKNIQETPEVKKNKAAHAMFLRVTSLLSAIEKNDEIYGEGVRRYCLNKSELTETMAKIEQIQGEIDEIREDKDDFKNIDEFYRTLCKLEDSLTKNKQYAKGIRAEMERFEDKHCMSVKAALQAVPKKTESKLNPLKEALM